MFDRTTFGLQGATQSISTVAGNADTLLKLTMPPDGHPEVGMVDQCRFACGMLVG